MAITRQRLEDIALFLGLMSLALWLLLSMTGCILDPGSQTREGLSQTKEYRFKDRELVVTGIGPQEEAFTAWAGACPMTTDSEGNPVPDYGHADCRLTHYLRSDPSADEAAATMAAILLSNQRQAEAFYASIERTLETLSNVLELALPVLVPEPVPPGGPEPAPDGP